MYSAKSFKLTKEEYDYLLPVLQPKLLYRADGGVEEYAFISDNIDCLEDMLLRLKGAYGCFNEGLPSMLVYKCSFNGELKLFRNYCQNQSSTN